MKSQGNLFKSLSLNIKNMAIRSEDMRKKNAKFSRASSQLITGPSIVPFTCNRSSPGATHQWEIYQGLGPGTYTRAFRVILKIPDFKQTIFLVDTGSNISLIHEMFIENESLSKVDSIIVSGVTTHSLKTKYGIIKVEMFEKKHIFHILDDYSLVKHQGIIE